MAEPNRTDPIQGEIIHEYDGIEEADNALPQWWFWTFCATVAFAVGYWYAYHEFHSYRLPLEEYEAELEAQLGAEPPPTAEALDELSHDPTTIASGRALFVTNCVTCHEARAQGKIGPNLTDNAWLYGGSPTDIYGTISRGTRNGMPAWVGPIGTRGVRRVTAYVISLRNTNVRGKAPQGSPWSPAPVQTARASSD